MITRLWAQWQALPAEVRALVVSGLVSLGLTLNTLAAALIAFVQVADPPLTTPDSLAAYLWRHFVPLIVVLFYAVTTNGSVRGIMAANQAKQISTLQQKGP